MKTWLVMDVNNLCHRAYHAMGDLSHNGQRTGATFGVFKDLVHFTDLFQTNKVIFCFDVGKSPSKREEIYPAYKQNRRDAFAAKTQQERLAYLDFKDEISRLRRTHLTKIGYQNIHWHAGYEADDMAAAFVKWSLKTDKAIIISSDKDYYQLLKSNVSVYHPITKLMVTHDMFKKTYGLPPFDWVGVKAIAGCPTDNVKGVPGVGEKTAAKFLCGKLNEKSKAHQKIMEYEGFTIKNKKLVKIPFPGCPNYEIVPDELSLGNWQAVMDELGFRSLVSNPPFGLRKDIV